MCSTNSRGFVRPLRNAVAFVSVAAGLLITPQITSAQVPTSECKKSDGTSGMITSLLAGSAVGYNISMPGTYCLANDVNYSWTGTAIFIGASNVTLDLNGHGINGARSNGVASVTTGDGIGIAGSPQNVVIRNGRISGYNSGISITTNSGSNAVTNLIVENMFITNVSYSGIYVGLNSTCIDCTIQNNTIMRADANLCTNCSNYFAHGINVGPTRARIMNNSITSLKEKAGGYGAFGITVGANSVVEGNVIESESAAKNDYGVSVAGANVVVANNRMTNMRVGVTFNGYTGIYSGNMTVNTTTPYMGGTPQGLNF